jgi:predicted metalloprotease with PDZ domain
MIKKCIYLVCSIFIFTACTSKKTIYYTVSSNVNDSIPSLKVTLECTAEKNGETTLLFLDRAWGENGLHKVLRNLKSLNEGVEIIQNKDSGWIRLKHPVTLKKIRFEYDIIQDIELPLTSRKTYRPIIQQDYFHVFSHNLFMLPRAYTPNSDAPFNVQIQWKGFEDSFALINTFDANAKTQKIENTNERSFHSGLFIGGDFRHYPITIQNNTVAYAIRGQWEKLQDTTMVSILKKTITVQRDFWKDHSQKHFTVTTIPTHQEQGSSFQGTGLTNAFATSAGNNEHLELEGLVYLFNHELQHNWIGHTIRNANEEEQYWFSEGFTDYYTIKNIAKNRIHDLDGSYFIKQFNQTIKTLYASPVKEAPNSEINYDNFWTNHDYEKLPYRRGAIFAFYLDHKIRKDHNNQKSLDDLMLAIKKDALQNDQRIDHRYFIQKANTFLNDDITPFFTQHIINGEWFDLKAIFTEFGHEFSPTTVVFDLGFTFSEDKKTIADIDPTSNAYKAGLREGDRITLRSYYNGYTAYEATFKVRKGKEEILYKYFPTKEANLATLKDVETNKKMLSF